MRTTDTSTHRLFVAIDLSDALRGPIEAALDALRGDIGVRWVRPEGRHLTLCFLGDTPAQRLPWLAERITEVSLRHAPHQLRIMSAGTFGSPSAPRVLWLGVGGEVEVTRRLQGDLAAALDAPREHAGWAPHVTLGRSRTSRGDAALARAAQTLKDVDIGVFAASEVVLFESRDGRYVRLHAAPLTACPDESPRSS